MSKDDNTETLSDGEIAYDCIELDNQEYAGNNCVFSVGFVEGHPHDTIYLRLIKDGENEWVLLLRPDESLAIARLLTGAVWSQLVEGLPDES